MDLFKLGEDKETGEILEITEVEGGLDCNCVCPNCEEDLVAAQGAKTEWYFRHYDSTNCNAGPEKGIQKLTKEIIGSNSRIKLPSLGVIKYENIETDKAPDFLSKSPGLFVKTNGTYLHFKIKINEEDTKSKIIPQEDGFNSIEIDLTDYVFTSKNDFRKDLLNKASHKRIMFWEEESSKGRSIIPTVLGLLGAGIVLGALTLSESLKSQDNTSESSLLNRKNLLKNYENILDKISNKL